MITDPVNPKFVMHRRGDCIMRGHAYHTGEDAARRAWDDPKWRLNAHGFRLSCTLPCRGDAGVVQ